MHTEIKSIRYDHNSYETPTSQAKELLVPLAQLRMEELIHQLGQNRYQSLATIWGYRAGEPFIS